MADDRPLHVRVAEALGWASIHVRGRGACGHACGDIAFVGQRWSGRAPGNMLVGEAGVHDHVPPFGEDSPEGWACTGPLMGLYEITFDRHPDGWSASAYDPDGAYLRSEPLLALTPLQAVALVILDISTRQSFPKPLT